MAQADSDNSTPTPAAERPRESTYLPIDMTPEEIFRAIGKLRKDARDEIDRLLTFLDETENHMCIDDEDGGDDEPDTHDEPSLGFLHMNDQTRICEGLGGDREDEHDGREPQEDDEPSLGTLDRQMDQRLTMQASGYAWSVVDGEQ